MKIVYQSKTGFTEKYAKMLGERLGITPIRVKDYRPATDDEIIFLSWVTANGIAKLSKVKGKCKIKCIGAVGLAVPSEENTNNLLNANKICDIPLFYLRGGVDFTKLKGLTKWLMKTIVKSDIKKNVIVGDSETILTKGISFVSEDNLDEITTFIRS